MIDKVQDNTIIICELDYRKKLLKELSNQKLFLNVKFFSKKEFFKKYLFSFDEKTILYLVREHNLKVDIAKMWLNNLYFIDEQKEYKSVKLQKLVNLKKELTQKNLLIYDNKFKENVSQYKILVLGYEYLESYEEEIFNTLNASILDNEVTYNHTDVFEFASMEEEVVYIAKNICKLINNGIDINQIKLANVSEDYYNTLTRIFKFYNIPVKVPYSNTLYSNLITQKFLENYNSDIKLAIETIKDRDSKIVNKIIDICNKYVFVNDYNEVKDLIIHDLKNTKLSNFNLKNYIEVVEYNYPFDDEYVFLMNFNTGSIPKLLKDESYITDNIKLEINAKSVTEINKTIKSYTINKIKSIKNLIITYKLKSDKSEFYPSFLINELNLEVKKEKMDILNSYSVIKDKIDYARKIDDYLKYGNLEDSYYIYKNTFKDINYGTYNNSFKEIDKTLLKEYLNNRLVLSYSSLNNYNKCAFRYYIANVLKLDKYEENFEAFIGSIFHDVLEKCFIYNLNVTDEINEYIKQSNKVLTIKERFFVNKVISDINYVIEVLKEQNKHISLDKALYEKNISIDKSKDDMQIEFIGFVDKILYKETSNNTLVSIIDYKTGFIDIELKYVPYGLSLQLPIYLYLVKKSNLFVNPKFVGFYLQYILDKDITRNTSKSFDAQKKDNLKLMGYSINDSDYLEKFDDTYVNSELIKGMKTKNDGSFSSYSKVLSEEQMNNLIEATEKNVDEAIENIINGKFDINPKKIGYFNDVGCKYCKFKDLCFKKEDDYQILEDIDDLDFLGGEEDA
ncbi:MAG: PD-(D/E)XK nuclease family protein [Bacilli bacterium]|nr:PD-(D/E)XK nuclease family protein [Bacilli bacterium]